MKQLLQSLDTGKTQVADVPCPSARGARVLVRTRASVISSGTERMLVEFGRAGFVEKARSQPDKVKQVLDRVRTDGLISTADAVRSKLSVPIPLGYCNAGVVVEAGSEDSPFRVRDRVVTNGPHAEFVVSPVNLTALIPAGVDFSSAAFTPLAAIALQGIRLAQPTLGERVVVFGLGVIGLLAVQLLRANGCEVLGIDPNPERRRLAETFGAVTIDPFDGDVAARVTARTGGIGADAVLLTLAGKSDQPVQQAAEMTRKRGRIVLVGTTGLNLRRDDFYKKELSFAVSCSYGPGRYDPTYEESGQDYPLPYVRWTEQRNFEAVLALMATGTVDPRPLVTHAFDIADAPDAYDLIAGSAPHLGIVLNYPVEAEGASADDPAATASRSAVVSVGQAPRVAGDGSAGVIGAGNFALRTFLPALRAAGFPVNIVASGQGTSAAIAAAKFGIPAATTDSRMVLEASDVSTVFILTRHDTHAQFAAAALRSGKHTFVEKPLALTAEELDEVRTAVDASGRLLMVGFNRRFAPLTGEVKRLLESRSGPVSIVATINAGHVPADNWLQDRRAGGGRIVGEACHWIDLARYLAGSAIVSMQATAARDASGAPVEDIAHIALSFADGSTAVVNYLAHGARDFPKERIECFYDGRVSVIDNWRRVKHYGRGATRPRLPRAMEKGHVGELRAWHAAVRGEGPPPIPLAELFEVSAWSIRAAELVRAG